MHTFVVHLLSILLSIFAHADLVQPNDGPYRGLRTDQTLYIYDDADLDALPELHAFTEAMRPIYQRSFSWTLDEEEDVIFASPNQQYGNGFATVMPNLKTFWWPSGAGDLEDLAMPSWGRFLASHETAHLYQLNAKGYWNSRLKRVFGNAGTVNLFVWPITIHPNLVLPTSMLEGNAVLNESRIHLGGRLHSGEVRATVFRLIADGQVDASRLINSEFKFPYGEAAYDLGAYFMAHLNGKYGIARTNGFFLAQGNHWLNPLILNRTFREHFGASFYQEVREFTRELEPAAAAQRTLSGEPLAEGVRVGPLNHDRERVWWLANPGYRTPDLFVLNKRTGAVEHRTIDLLHGKVFFKDNQSLTAASNQNDLHHLSLGLYGEHARLEPGTAGHIVTDERGGHRVGLDAARSWLSARVLFDGQPYDDANSRPILDYDGNVFYFRQVGEDRLLYRNRELVARVRGFYAKLTEVDERGRVHFIGSTERGSTLYRFDGAEVTRLIDSDAVFDARVISNDRAVVDEVTSRGHRVMLASLTPRPATPAVFAYPFATETVQPVPPLPRADFARAPHYQSLREIRFSELGLGLGYVSGLGPLAGLNASFRDPLEYHALGFDLGYTGRGPRSARLQYAFERYLTKPYAQYTYREDTWRSNSGRYRYADQEANLGFNLPVLRRGRWDMELNVAAVLEREGASSVTTTTHDAGGTFAKIGARRLIPSPLGMYAWRNLQTSLAHRYVNDADGGEQAAALDLSIDHGFTGEYYLSGGVQLARANGPYLRVGYAPVSLGTRLIVPRLTGESFDTRGAARARVEGRRVITLPRYDTRIPLGLNRFALVIAGQALALDRAVYDGPSTVLEAGYGVDVDALVAHKLQVTSRFLTGFSNAPSTDGRAFTQVSLNVKGAF